MTLTLLGAVGIHQPPYANRALIFARAVANSSAPLLGLFLKMRSAAGNHLTQDVGAVCWKLCCRWYMDPQVFRASIARYKAQRERDRVVEEANRKLRIAQIKESEARFEKNKELGRLVLDAYRKGRSTEELCKVFGMSIEDVSATIQAGLFANTKRLSQCS